MAEADRNLAVDLEKMAHRIGKLSRRGLDALAVVTPVLAKVGKRLAEYDRLLYAERKQLAEDIAGAMDQAVKIVAGRDDEDDL